MFHCYCNNVPLLLSVFYCQKMLKIVALYCTILVFLFGLTVCRSSGNISATELSALHDLYSSTDGAHWLWRNSSGPVWDFSVPDPNPCYPPWQGLTCVCTSDNCSISQVNLTRYNLAGTLPSSIGNL